MGSVDKITVAALQLMPSRDSQFSSALNTLGDSEFLDDTFNTSSSPWIGNVDMSADMPTDDIILRSVGDTILPIEECEKHQSNNTTLGLILNLGGNLTEIPVKCLDHAPVLTYSSSVRVAILTAMAVVSLLGNTATIFSIRRNRSNKRLYHQSWNAVYALIFHLSVADLFVTLFCIAGEAAWSYTVAWIAGNIACKVFKFLQMFSLYLSTFVLVLIGVDRFVVVRYPMKSLSTAKRLNKLIAFVWALSLVLSIPQLVIFHVSKGPFYEEFYQCVTYGFYTHQWQEQLYTTFSLVCMFILPLVILISTYVSTIITISRSEKVFRAEVATGGKCVASDANRRRIIHRAKMKSLRISVVIVVAFIVWWTPYYTMMIIFMFLNPDKHVSDELQSGIFFFGMSNSLVNPIIYGAFHLWQPRKKRTGSAHSDYRSRHASSSIHLTNSSDSRSSYRDGCGLQRRSTMMTNNTVVDPRGSTRVIRTLNHNGSPQDEETSMMLIDEVGTDARRLSAKILQRYKGVISGGTNGQTHI